MVENNNKTYLPPYIGTLYIDAFFGAVLTHFIDLARVQTGNPSFTASETLFHWLLFGTLMHLFGSVAYALFNRYLLRRLANDASAMPEPPVVTTPMPVTFTEPDEEANDDSFWSMAEADDFWSSVEVADE